MASSHPFQNLIVTYAPGEKIFTEGEVGGTMFIVHSGRARLFREANGRSVEIAEMEKGDFFGEMSLLEGAARNLSAAAVDHLELIEINSTTFDRMIRGNIEIAVRLLRKLSGRLQKMEQQISSLQESAARAAAAAPGEAPAPQPVSVPAARAAPAPGTRLSRPAPASRAAADASSKNEAVRAVPAPSAPASAPAPLSATLSAPAAQSAATATAVAAPAHPTPSPAAAQRSAAPIPGPARTAAGREAGAAGPKLVCEAGDAVFPLRTSESTIGRYDPVTETQPEVDLTLVDTKRSVSRRHAKIVLRNGAYFLTEEVGALNGTFLNGSKLVTGKPAELKNGDQISLGTVSLVFRA